MKPIYCFQTWSGGRAAEPGAPPVTGSATRGEAGTARAPAPTQAAPAGADFPALGSFSCALHGPLC